MEHIREQMESETRHLNGIELLALPTPQMVCFYTPNFWIRLSVQLGLPPRAETVTLTDTRASPLAVLIGTFFLLSVFWRHLAE
jgi:hypothetical protein